MPKLAYASLALVPRSGMDTMIHILSACVVASVMVFDETRHRRGGEVKVIVVSPPLSNYLVPLPFFGQKEVVVGEIHGCVGKDSMTLYKCAVLRGDPTTSFAPCPTSINTKVKISSPLTKSQPKVTHKKMIVIKKRRPSSLHTTI